jgi:DNA-binding NtrC family response regulator
VPSLRERKEDVYLLFRKFISDFSVKYRSPNIQLNEEAKAILAHYTWPGNIRQLKNVAEQISVLQNGQQEMDAQELIKYLPFEQPMSGLPAKLGQHADNDFSERDILYKVLFDMKKDLTDLKKVVLDLLQNSGTANEFIADNTNIINKLVQEINPTNLEYSGFQMPMQVSPASQSNSSFQPNNFHSNPYKLDAPIEEVEETLSLEDKEIDYIKKALKKHKGKRKLAAQELGISERTLYRKIKEYDINL